MGPILRWLEPFALDLWRHHREAWLPDTAAVAQRQLFCGGLYQVLVLTVVSPAL